MGANMTVEEKLKQLPTDPGVYIYSDIDGNVLYVGKAKNLKNRIKQYFMAGNKQEKVLAMLSHMHDFRYIITPSETDALSLENTLIKRYKPPYNILLKDDKQYSYIKINFKDDFPKLMHVRKIVKDGCKYFGPIMGSARALMELIAALYPTITCKYNFDKLPKNFRPCLNKDIGRCPAPCVGNIDKITYRATIDSIIELLSGNDEKTVAKLEEKMLTASENEQYEQALVYKQQLATLKKLKESRIVTLTKAVDYDIFSIVSNGKNAVVNQMTVRGGKVIFSDNYAVTDAGIDLAQTLTSYVNAYCDGANELSKEILLNTELDDAIPLSESVSKLYGRKVTISCPKQSTKRRLVEMSQDNAVEYLTKSQISIDRQYDSTVGACSQLKRLLNLRAFPKRIECYDISNISGVDKVASMVVFTNGLKDGKAYRRFKIRTVNGANDFACMQEVLERRLQRIRDVDEVFGESPDLIVVDGGLGQLAYAEKALLDNEFGIELISLAKREERVYTLTDGDGILLPRNSHSLNLLINIRDEAHRFAITYFRNLHTKNGLKSMLSEIEGVGKKRMVALIRKFGSVANITDATVEQIMEVDGINVKVAQNIVDYFNK